MSGLYASLFQKITNHTVQGSYHTEFAIILRNLATAEKREDYFHQAIKEYEAADREFKLARNPIFRASMKDNVGLLLYKLGHYTAAHKYLEEARRLSVAFKDKARTAQFDETRAQVFIAEGKYKQAETVAHRAALSLGQANGSVAYAASLLGASYQALCYTIESRHPDLLKERTPIRRRRTKKPDK